MVWDEKLLLGQILYNRLKDASDGMIAQIDAGTGKSETYKSVLDRSVRLAIALRKLGMKPGDILAYSGKNHLDVHIPYYAGIMNGYTITGVDPNKNKEEIKVHLRTVKPNIAFCDFRMYDDFVTAASELGLDIKVFKFGKGDNSMGVLIDSVKDEDAVKNFEPAVFPQDNVYCWLVSTGGTTGVFKLAAFKHKPVIHRINAIVHVFNKKSKDKENSNIEINLSPVQWLSAFYLALTPLLLHDIKLQTSKPVTPEHCVEILTKYKPDAPMLPPCTVAAILKTNKTYDFAGIKSILLSGAKVHREMILELKERLPKGSFPLEGYGQTENLGPIFAPNPLGPIGTCGKPFPHIPVKLVDPETGKEINEPNVIGELWTKCDSCMTEYYNNPEETAKAFEDGWFKTGDLMYRDEDNNYFFVERFKLLIKYANHHFTPSEVEEVIRTHPGVLDVAVTSISNAIDDEHPIACVVRVPDSKVTEKEICELVVDKLSKKKELRAGVLFMDQLPYTSSHKIARAKLQKIVMEKVKERESKLG